jgi:hypothetical protein
VALNGSKSLWWNTSFWGALFVSVAGSMIATAWWQFTADLPLQATARLDALTEDNLVAIATRYPAIARCFDCERAIIFDSERAVIGGRARAGESAQKNHPSPVA